jgi:superfamily II DNA or RNA helicase
MNNDENLLLNMPKTLTTYLGQKGYTISKNELNLDQQNLIRKELTVKPYTPGPTMGNAPAVTFPAYRESSGKMYVPRYFGEQYFGPAKSSKISEGSNISLTFNGTLRDYQAPVVQTFLDHVTKSPVTGGGGLLELYCAWGKTSASLYIATKLAKKTLVIVHKEFLMNQWIERISQFIPNARVGKIQGQIIDIEDKDIVLCMLQSLSMKDYDAAVFESFGLTIIDEVHHIGSEVFSRALFKLVTKYTLGLSATMNRKDGTTKVFKMFLGDIVYTAIQKKESTVEVRALTFKTSDEDFNETIYDFRGQPQNSSMISKLCSYNARTEFIIKTLNDFIAISQDSSLEAAAHKKAMDLNNPACELCKRKENYLLKNTCCGSIKYCLPCLNNIVDQAKINMEETVNKKTGVTKCVKKRPKCPACEKVLAYEQNYIENPFVKPIAQAHTIIMSHNLNVLEYIYNKFVCKNYASVGYYVGGMTEPELKRSEKQQVVLSSYQMASEGLDIPTLNAEFLISPKTDIVQIVGRILRAKHATTHPIIYDFVDTHEVFQRQWLKRKAYYKKQGYTIIGTDSGKYFNNNNNNKAHIWNTIYDPNKPTTKKEKNKNDELSEDDVSSEDEFGCVNDNSDKELNEFKKKSLAKNDFIGGRCLLKIKK